MFLRCSTRKKNGKEHRAWSIVENKRCVGNKIVQRHVLYLGEINDQQQAAWQKTIEIFEYGQIVPRTVALFPEDRGVEIDGAHIVRVKLGELQLRHPRQWGACWLACHLYEELGLNEFWAQRLPVSRKGTRWDLILQTLCAYRLIDPGSESRLHRQWYEQSAMGDLLGADFALAHKDTLYRCLDRLLVHKADLFSFLQQRWKSLFGADFEVLLYDLTSTYFECDPPASGKRRFGYSRDKRPDCVQVIIALVVTPDGLPLAYEVMAGNTSEKTTLKSFLDKIEKQYGQAKRVWVMDRGIPTEEQLKEMREATSPVAYLVGTPRGRLGKLEKQFLERPWGQVKESVEVKLLPREGELYILARSEGRRQKERAIRQRRLKRLWARLRELQGQELTRDELLLKLGAAKADAGRVYGLVEVQVPKPEQPVNAETFAFRLRRDKLRQAFRREGHYLLRSKLPEEDPARLWQHYVQLTEIEAVFRALKSDLAIRPIHHRKDSRIEAHIFVSFLAYCLYVTLRQRLRTLAPGLTPRAVLEKMSAIQMVDVRVPTTDGRLLILPRYTQPETDHQMLLHELHLQLPAQPPPRILQQELESVVEGANL